MAMDRTQRLQLRSAHEGARASTEQPLIAALAASALVVALSVYGVLRAAPHLMTSFEPVLARLPEPSTSLGWVAPAVAVGVFLFGASLAAFGLTAYVQGVRRDPFRFLAPVLIGFASMVMVPLELERSMGHVQATLFAAVSALFLLGGGVLLQAQGALGIATGSVLLSLPTLGLVLDRVQHAGVDRLLSLQDRGSLLVLLVMCLTSFGVGLTAYIARPSGELVKERLRDRNWERYRQQLGEALEHARLSELRAGEAEARASELEQLISEHCERIEADSAAHASFEAEAAALTGKRGGGLRAFLVFCAFVIGASAGAVALHAWKIAPLQTQLSSERVAAATTLAAREQRASEAQSAREQLQAERTRLQAELQAERTRLQAALAEATLTTEKLATLEAQAAAAIAPEPEPKKPARARLSKARAARNKREASTARAAASTSAPASGALREAVDDDPIGGL